MARPGTLEVEVNTWGSCSCSGTHYNAVSVAFQLHQRVLTYPLFIHKHGFWTLELFLQSSFDVLVGADDVCDVDPLFLSLWLGSWTSIDGVRRYVSSAPLTWYQLLLLV